MTAVESVPAVSREHHLRLARLHLRLGAHELARAELEAAAGDGSLDEDALLDLAEVRWRTGDLPGAGVAASAYLSTGRDEPLGLAIAAEAAGAAGHALEARALASRTLESLGADPTALDGLFAGMARGAFWPVEQDPGATSTAGLFAELVTTEPPTAIDPDVTDVAGTPSEAEAEAVGPGLWGDEPAPARELAPPGEAVRAARAALEGGDAGGAAKALAGLLRDRPDLTLTVLAALEALDGDGPRDDERGGDLSASDDT
jgi:hypothetical protein